MIVGWITARGAMAGNPSASPCIRIIPMAGSIAAYASIFARPTLARSCAAGSVPAAGAATSTGADRHRLV
jgi:hypothetical protein